MKNQDECIVAKRIYSINKLKDNLSTEVYSSKKRGEDSNYIDWHRQLGVLITQNEAKLFLDLLEKYIEDNE